MIGTKQKLLIVSSLVALVLVSGCVAPEPGYKVGDVYTKTFNLIPSESVSEDTDFSDEKVTYIYKIYGIYTVSGEEIAGNQEQLSSVSSGVAIPVTVSYTIEPTTPKGKLIAMAAIVRIDGTYDKTSDQWAWSYKVLAKEGEALNVG